MDVAFLLHSKRAHMTENRMDRATPASFSLRLALWQTVSRHLDIAESLDSTAELLAKQIPIQSLSMCRLDAEHHRARTIASWPSGISRRSFNDVQLSESDWRRLDRWLRQ